MAASHSRTTWSAPPDATTLPSGAMATVKALWSQALTRQSSLPAARSHNRTVESPLDDASLGEFQWKDTIGDPDRRQPFRAWGGLQPTGPGLEEIVQFCKLVDAEPLICVRVSKRKPADAAEEVQYFNGAENTPMGALRAKNGHAKPYGIKYWQVGNERAGQDYEARLAAFCKA